MQTQPHQGLATLTYSALKAFKNCRKFYQYRYIKGLKPLETAESLSFGSNFHEVLEAWHRGADRDSALKLIDSLYPNRAVEPAEKRQHHLLRAMFIGYADRHPAEDFKAVKVEEVFSAPIANPATGRKSLSFVMQGKADLIVEQEGRFFLVEHKTAASITGDYLERLPMDFQILLYAHCVRESLGLPISGVIYNVAAKSGIRQSEGETESEFEARRSELAAKSKSGRSSAKRRMPETDEEFQARLAAKYSEPGMFHRELVYISQDQLAVLLAEVWELTQQILIARRNNRWYLNSDYCFRYNRPCAYFPLCRSGENPNLIENAYRIVEPHEELRSNGAAEPEEPVF